MILLCPSCSARFLVADALIPPAGRTVRCGACKHEWFVQAPAPPADAPVVDNPHVAEALAPVEAVAAATPSPEVAAVAEPLSVPEGVVEIVAPPPRQLPVLVRTKLKLWPFATAAAVLGVLWLVLGFIGYFPTLHRAPVLDGIYGAFGTTNTEGLVFHDVKMEQMQQEGRTQFVLSGSIANHAYKARTLPRVRVELKDKKGKVMWSRVYPVDHVIKPGEIYPFRIDDIKTSFAANVSTIVMDIGNRFELMVR